MRTTANRLMIFCWVLALSVTATAAEPASPAADRTAMGLLLNSYAALGEGHIDSVLSGLRIISATDEARSGTWEKMQGLLAEFEKSGIRAAAVWFVRPDGSYYTVQKGLVGENLRDRDYFPRLMAGTDVAGDLVISKSTGRRTAIVAVPIRKEGKVIGGLGASLAVEEISRMIDAGMGLPENMFFYALDRQGRTSLHRLSALLFAYPSDMGSKSLATTVDRMLAAPEGSVTYDFYGERTVLFRKYPLTGWVYAIGLASGTPGKPVAELPPILGDLGKEVEKELFSMDRDLAKTAQSFGAEKLTHQEKRKELADLCLLHPAAVDCSFVDRSGRMALVEPREYGKFEGSDISTQEQVVRLQRTRKPVLSNTFRAVEGFEAVDLEHPVLSPSGELLGSVSMLIKPDALFSSVLTPVLRGMPVESFAMQKDGRILFDEDKDEVGRMLFQDPVYRPFPQLLALGSLIAREPAGAGAYDYKQHGSEQVVRKDAHWTTVGLHGTEWRLVVMHVRTGHGDAALRDRDGLERAAREGLRDLAQAADLRKALSRKDQAGIRKIFQNFYAAHAALYSIQWLDSTGVNRYGYPEENSLISVDMHTAKTDSAKPMLRSLSGKEESTFDSPLVEGKTGRFLMVPVYDGSVYLGMIYTITLQE